MISLHLRIGTNSLTLLDSARLAASFERDLLRRFGYPAASRCRPVRLPAPNRDPCHPGEGHWTYY